MPRKRTESPLAILTRDHNFRKGRIAAIPAWCKALDIDLQQKVRDIVDEQLTREEWHYESACTALKTGDPMNAITGLPHLQNAMHEAYTNIAQNKS